MNAAASVLLLVGVNVLASTAATASGRTALRAYKLPPPNPLVVALLTAGALVAVSATAKRLGEKSS